MWRFLSAEQLPSTIEAEKAKRKDRVAFDNEKKKGKQKKMLAFAGTSRCRAIAGRRGEMVLVIRVAIELEGKREDARAR